MPKTIFTRGCRTLVQQAAQRSARLVADQPGTDHCLKLVGYSGDPRSAGPRWLDRPQRLKLTLTRAMRKNATAQAMTTSNKSDASARTRGRRVPRAEARSGDGVISAAIGAARIRTTSTFIAAGWPATPMLDALRAVRANDG